MKDVADVYFYDAAALIHKHGADAVNAFATSDERQAMLMGMKRFTKADQVNTVAARRRIADKAIAEGKYIF